MDPLTVGAISGVVLKIGADVATEYAGDKCRKLARKVAAKLEIDVDEVQEGLIRLAERAGCSGGHDWQPDDPYDEASPLHCAAPGCKATRTRSVNRMASERAPQEQGHVPAIARWLLG